MYFAIFYPNVADSYWLLLTNSASRFDCLECPPGPETWAGRARPHSSCSPCLHACFRKKGCPSANVKRGKRWDQSTWKCWNVLKCLLLFKKKLPNLWDVWATETHSLFENPNLTVKLCLATGEARVPGVFFVANMLRSSHFQQWSFFSIWTGKGEKHPNEYGYND